MKRYKFILVAISVLIAFSSCDYLDLEPQDGVIKDNFWKTKEDVNSAVLGCYAAMMDDALMQRVFIWGEGRADMIKLNTNVLTTFTDFTNLQNGDITPSNGFNNWSTFYTVINNCNTVLAYAKDAYNADNSFSEELLKQYEAEAVCVRSLMYFYLVRTFGDVPLVLEASLTDEQSFSVPKVEKEVILDSLVAQLKRVDRTQNGTNMGLPYSYDRNDETKGRFTVWSLKALLADIYLWMDDYESCANECNLIMGSGQYALIPISKQEVTVENEAGELVTVYYPVSGDIDNFFQNVYYNGNSIESIFELQYGTDKTNPWFEYTNPNSGRFIINTEFVQYTLFESSELDRGYFDIRTEGVSYMQSYIWKWVGTSRESISDYRSSSESFSNWIFYRLSDIYLMRAEALCQLGKKTGNADYLRESLELVTAIRLRANAPESTELISPDEINIDADRLEQFILDERAREFSYEGKRWFDVLRNAKRDNFSGINYLLILATYAAESNKIMSLQTKWRGDSNSLYLPIHEDEIRRNNGVLVQNPYYEY